LLSSLHSNEDIFLEPAAVAGIIGAHRLAQSEEGQSYLQEKELIDKMSQATHLAWGTGGSMVPEADRKEFLADSSQASL
ncbi:MAG: D-serine ammonia-lyase, partial [Alkalibacterium sp.]|nr:D-serine ammonia-lyase [Alkalibacterium sp.]